MAFPDKVDDEEYLSWLRATDRTQSPLLDEKMNILNTVKDRRLAVDPEDHLHDIKAWDWDRMSEDEKVVRNSLSLGGVLFVSVRSTPHLQMEEIRNAAARNESGGKLQGVESWGRPQEKENGGRAQGKESGGKPQGRENGAKLQEKENGRKPQGWSSSDISHSNELYYAIVTAVYPFLRNILPNHNLSSGYACIGKDWSVLLTYGNFQNF